MFPWRRNLYILFFTQVVSTAGFSLVVPFLPLYVEELGASSFGSVEFWSGLAYSAQAVTMALSAPFWGTVADRYGRKLMLVRANLGGAVILAAMGFCRSAEQLVILRALQGFVTGTIPAASALVAATSPRERSGEALGMIQMGAWVGVSVGPLIGGVIGDLFGFRESFWVTGCLLAFSSVAVMLWVREDFRRPVSADRSGMFAGYRRLVGSMQLIGLYAITFLQSVGRTLILPVAALFVMQLMESRSGVASVTGLLMGTKAFTGSISAVWLGRLSDRVGHRKVLALSALSAVIFYLPQPFVQHAWQLVVLQALSGIADGGIIPAVGALINLATPPGNQGTTFGMNTSINSAGRGIAPLLGGVFAMGFGLRGVFALTAVVYAVAIVAALRLTPPAGWKPQPNDP